MLIQEGLAKHLADGQFEESMSYLSYCFSMFLGDYLTESQQSWLNASMKRRTRRHVTNFYETIVDGLKALEEGTQKR